MIFQIVEGLRGIVVNGIVKNWRITCIAICNGFRFSNTNVKRDVIFLKYRIRAENQIPPSQDLANRQPEVTPPRGAEGSSPTTSTPRENGTQGGAIRKNTYWDRDKSVSGIFSPIRGEVSAPAGTFYHLHRSRMDLLARGESAEESVNENNAETEMEDEEEDDNHKTTGLTNAATKGSDEMLVSVGPSVIEQTKLEESTEGNNNKEKVETEQEEEDRHEEGEPGQGLMTRSRRKQLKPKRFVKK